MTSANTAQLAPIPRARVAIATAVRVGERSNVRAAKRRSLITSIGLDSECDEWQSVVPGAVFAISQFDNVLRSPEGAESIVSCSEVGQGVLRVNSERSPASQGHLDSNPIGARALENQRRRGHILDGDARAVEHDNLVDTPTSLAGASENLIERATHVA